MADKRGCARCGSVQCVAFGSLDLGDIVSCRDREIMNLRAFLRTKVREVEMIRDQVDNLLESLG